LLESAYQKCLEKELVHHGLAFESQKPLGITYRGEFMPEMYRLDFIVEGLVIVEVKSVLRWEPVFDAQVMTYLKLLDLRLGLLLNFHVPIFRDGIKRIVRGLDDPQFGGLRPFATSR
jgi:GxxExxY protein